MKIEYEMLHRRNQHYLNEGGLREMIAICAYFKAEKRGFVTGFELQDWLEAEQEINDHCSHWFEEC